MINRAEIFPLLGNKRKRADYLPVDLSREHLLHIGINSSTGVKAYLDHATQQGRLIAYGGYGEDRPIYENSNLYTSVNGTRDIHLGIDLWQGTGTAVYAPMDGVIHSFANNNVKMDYGYTVVLSHEHPVIGKFHTIYGHLASDEQHRWVIGDKMSKGSLIGLIGDDKENGGWSPHLHFQMIKDMEGHVGTYPGVCDKADADHYLTNCPDPMLLIRLGD